MIGLPTYQHGNDKEETNQYLVPAKRFLKKRPIKMGKVAAITVNKNTEDCHMALNEEAVEKTPSSLVHLVNQSFDVNLSIWSQWQTVSIKGI